MKCGIIAFRHVDRLTWTYNAAIGNLKNRYSKLPVTGPTGDYLQFVIDSHCHSWSERRFTVRPDQRVVTKMPLAEIWDDTGTLTGERIRHLDQGTLQELVRSGSVQFVVAEPGLKLNWIPIEKHFEFWKTVRPQNADSAKPIYLGQFHGGTAYIASEWRGPAGTCLVLLERHH